MKILYVIRVEEYFLNILKQLIIYEVLNIQLLQFVYVFMILVFDRSKLSKRYGVILVEEFFENGYLKEVIVNYFLFFGWLSGEDRIIISFDEVIQKFEFEKVLKNAVIYDINKFIWINGYYFKEIDFDDLYERMKYFYFKNGIDILSFDKEYVKFVLKFVCEKVKIFVEVVSVSIYFFDFNYEYE